MDTTTEPKVKGVILWQIDDKSYEVFCALCHLQWPITFLKQAWFCKRCNMKVEVEKREFKR